MAASKKLIDFYESDEGRAVKQALIKMDSDDSYNTKPTYSPDTESYPGNEVPFVKKHMQYLGSHPTDPMHYLSNLRLMTRIR